MAAVETKLAYAQALVKALKSVAPVSLGALLFKLCAYLMGWHGHFVFHKRSRLVTLVNMAMGCEAAFAIACAVHRMSAQKDLPDEQRPPPRSKEERNMMFDRCLHTVAVPQDFATKWLRDHHLEDIRRGNVEDWLAWGMFGKKPLELDADERAEMDYYIAAFEQRANHKFQDGHNGTIRCYKFTHEPVESDHRPLAYYAVVHGLLQRVVLPLALFANGFGGMHSCRSFNYFVRRAPGQKRILPPIVLIHGIGIGPLPYVKFAGDLANAAETCGVARDVVVLEIPAIAQQLFPPQLLPQMFLEDMQSLLDAQGYDRAFFVGHSYGTFAL